jgi:hypothetical protein
VHQRKFARVRVARNVIVFNGNHSNPIEAGALLRGMPQIDRAVEVHHVLSDLAAGSVFTAVTGYLRLGRFSQIEL